MPNKNSVSISRISHNYYMPRQSCHTFDFIFCNNVWRKEQIMKLLTVEPSSTSYYFSLGPVILLSTMFSSSLICSIEYNFKNYQKDTTTSFIELHTKDTAVNHTNIHRYSCHVPDNVVRFKKKLYGNRFS
jgi:hypothetical protein